MLTMVLLSNLIIAIVIATIVVVSLLLLLLLLLMFCNLNYSDKVIDCSMDYFIMPCLYACMFRVELQTFH